MTTMNSDEQPNTSKSRENVKKVLKKIDEALLKKGIGSHQERLLRIYKAVSAIERHQNCFVSKFPVDEGETHKTLDPNELFNNIEESYKPSVVLNEDEITHKVEFNFKDDDPKKENFKINMDELLTFVENELGMNGNNTSDTDEDKETDSSVKETDEAKTRKKEIAGKFNNIELKLRTFIKEHEAYNIFTESGMKSIRSFMQTPQSQKSKEITSPITFNFFQEEDVKAFVGKRNSHNPDTLRNDLIKLNEGLDKDATKPKFNSNAQFKTKPKKQEIVVKRFCANFEDEDDYNCIIEKIGEECTPKVTPKMGLIKQHSFSIEKRGSIFDNKGFKPEEINALEEIYDNDEMSQSDLSSVQSPDVRRLESPIKGMRFGSPLIRLESPKKQDKNDIFVLNIINPMENDDDEDVENDKKEENETK